MERRRGSEIVSGWPDEAKEAAQLVLDKYGEEPDEATDSFLVWHRAGPWKRIVASKTFWKHDFPAPHYDSIEGVLDFQVPPEKFTPLAEFDGSVVVERTAGDHPTVPRRGGEHPRTEPRPRHHDGRPQRRRRPRILREGVLDYRRGEPTPYMDGLRFESRRDPPDPDTRVLSDEQLAEAEAAGRTAGASR